MRAWSYVVVWVLGLAACARQERRASPEPRVVASESTPFASAGVTSVAPPRARGTGLGWVGSLPRAKGFTTYDVRVDAGDAPLELHWRLLRERRRPEAPAGQEYPALYVRAITLTAGTRTIPLGDHSGWPESGDLTSCRDQGFRQPPGEQWSFPDLPELVAAFNVATMQGSSDWIVLDAGGGRLHVLGRHTHDGACPKSLMQGPLEVCVDMTWERRFDLLVVADSRVHERITIAEDGGEDRFDCKSSYTGQRLLPPLP